MLKNIIKEEFFSRGRDIIHMVKQFDELISEGNTIKTALAQMFTSDVNVICIHHLKTDKHGNPESLIIKQNGVIHRARNIMYIVKNSDSFRNGDIKIPKRFSIEKDLNYAEYYNRVKQFFVLAIKLLGWPCLSCPIMFRSNPRPRLRTSYTVQF